MLIEQNWKLENYYTWELDCRVCLVTFINTNHHRPKGSSPETDGS